MAATELFRPDGSATGIFFCESCRVVYSNKDQAEWCHGERICSCGAKITGMYRNNKCDECQREEYKEKERKAEVERFDAATKIPYSEYKIEQVFSCDKYYPDVHSAIDEYLEGQEPEYVWACKDIGLQKASVEDVVDNILENAWEDADVNDLNGVDELEAAITAFNKANECVTVWEPDFTIAILTK